MSLKGYMDGSTWRGVGIAIGVLLVSLSVTAWLLQQGIVPETAMTAIVGGCGALACFCGGRTAVRRGSGGTLLRAIVMTALVYGLLWVAAWIVGQSPRLDGNGIIQTTAVWGGGILAGLVGRRNRRRKPSAGRRYGAKRRKGSVT